MALLFIVGAALVVCGVADALLRIVASFRRANRVIEQAPVRQSNVTVRERVVKP